MNNAKMWLVVNPSVGVPVFLGAVAVGSFAVHVAVLSNTSWVSDFLSGKKLGHGDREQAAATQLMTPDVQNASTSYVAPGPEGYQEVTVILNDGTPVTAYIRTDEVMASATGVPEAIIAQ